MLKTPSHGAKEKVKAQGVDDKSDSELIKTDYQFDDSGTSVNQMDLKLTGSGKSPNDVDSEDCSLDHTQGVIIDLEWQAELKSITRGQKLGKGSFGVVY